MLTQYICLITKKSLENLTTSGFYCLTLDCLLTYCYIKSRSLILSFSSLIFFGTCTAYFNYWKVIFPSCHLLPVLVLDMHSLRSLCLGRSTTSTIKQFIFSFKFLLISSESRIHLSSGSEQKLV